jgi:mono/diheme cytochrome c family protein
MRRAWWWLAALPVLAAAVDDPAVRGAAVYRTSCGVAYCHGPEGKAGRAPALAGRGLSVRAIAGIATGGIPNTSMPAFGGRLKPEDIEAVAAYIAGLGGGTASAPEPVRSAMPPEIEQGRALFFDATRTGACGSCHEVQGRGIAVSIALNDLRKARIQNPRTIEAPEAMTVQPRGETAFPALIVEKTASRLRVYDLSSRLPVLRTFTPEEAAVTTGATWRHRDAAGLYTDPELDAVVRYLRWAAER